MQDDKIREVENQTKEDKNQTKEDENQTSLWSVVCSMESVAGAHGGWKPVSNHFCSTRAGGRESRGN